MLHLTIAPRQPAAPSLHLPENAAGRAGRLTIEVVEGPEARDLLADARFAREWDQLHDSCPWATAFQARAFVSTWYDVYETGVTPVVVAGYGPEGALAGLLTLALSADGRLLSGTGTHHAEYQVWIAAPWAGDAFPAAAFAALHRRHPRAHVTLRYLPAGAPRAWLDEDPACRRRCAVRALPRGLVDVRSDHAAKSLRKRGNRSRLHRLGRLGDVTFEHVRDAESFSQALDEIVPMYDLRQGAMHGTLPFAEDRSKRALHEELFRAGLLHVTLLRVGGHIAAANVGWHDRGAVGVGVFAHCPVHARHSPGKIHLLLLAEYLRKAGLSAIDLTPGGGWKDRFATLHDTAYVLDVFPTAFGRMRHCARLRAEALARPVAYALGVTPDAVRRTVARVRHDGPIGLVRAAARRVASVRHVISRTTECRLYTFDASRAAQLEFAPLFATDRFEDLLRFTPTERWHSRQAFLAECLQRLEDGAHVFTCADGTGLLAYGWLNEVQQRSRPSEVDTEVVLPPGSAVAFDFHTHPAARGRGLHRLALAAALRHAGRVPGTRKIWMGVRADNGSALHNVQKLGWHYHCSLWLRARLGRRIAAMRRGADGPAVPAGSGLRPIKRAVFHVARAVGLFALARLVTRRELRILAYHGFELSHESAFGPRLFMRPETFERRLDLLERRGHPVLPLGEALRRLDDGTLPPAAVVITVDDGSSTVFPRARTALLARNLPATFYLTSYYVQRPAPVFRMALQYALWRTTRESLALAGLGPFDHDELRLADEGAREVVLWELIRHGERELHEDGRAALAREFAQRLGVDYEDIVASRRFSLLSPDEVRTMATEGFDIQLHTHRHRLPADEASARREIADNRAALEPLVGRPLSHLCYPSDERTPGQEPLLESLGIESGTTCDLGLNPPGTPHLALRRFLDGDCVSRIEFEAEISGFAELLRRGVRAMRPLSRR